VLHISLKKDKLVITVTSPTHAFVFFTTEAEDDARNSHLLFTLNVYQYKVDHDNSGQEEG